MGENTKIEWCDHTFNPWIGCAKVHAGCTNCYAEEMMDHRFGKAKWGTDGTRVVASEEKWKEPLKWDRAAKKDGVRRRAFCASLADVFEDWTGRIINNKGETLHRGEDWYIEKPFVTGGPVGKSVATMADARQQLFDLIDMTPNLDWLLLTKRPENIKRMTPRVTVNTQEQADDRDNNLKFYRRNLWLGLSVSDQKTFENHVHEMQGLEWHAAVRFLSIEPLLNDLKMVHEVIPEPGVRLQYSFGQFQYGSSNLFNTKREAIEASGLNWIILGGESGHNARPCQMQWMVDLVRECQDLDVPVFVKQLGSNFRMIKDGEEYGYKPRKGDSKGGDMSQWSIVSDELQVREWPRI